MKDSWSCRNYERGDELLILSLYQAVSGREMNLDFWKWKFEQGPFGPGIIKLMFDGDRLIGHYAVTPMNTEIENTPVAAVFSLDTMTHPDYERQGIFTYLAQETYRECQRQGFRFVFGFPNELSYPAFTRKLGWAGLGETTLWEKTLPANESDQLLSSAPTSEIHEVKRFDGAIDALWQKVKNDYHAIVPRTEKLLNWRYTEHPRVNYLKYVSRDTGGQIAGYVVLKVFSAESEMRGHLVDMLSQPDQNTVRGLVRGALAYFRDRGIKNVSCWLPDNSIYAEVIREAGFLKKEMPGDYPHFGVGVFDPGDRILQDIDSLANWYLTMGDDCDVF